MSPTRVLPDPRPQSEAAARAAHTHAHLEGLLEEIATVTEPAALGAKATHFRGLLIEHFREEEEPGGLFEELQAMRPEFQTRLTSLRSQHRELLGLVEWVAMKAVEEPCDTERLLTHRDRFVRELQIHKSTETDLLTDAFNTDIGVGD